MTTLALWRGCCCHREHRPTLHSLNTQVSFRTVGFFALTVFGRVLFLKSNTTTATNNNNNNNNNNNIKMGASMISSQAPLQVTSTSVPHLALGSPHLCTSETSGTSSTASLHTSSGLHLHLYTRTPAPLRLCAYAQMHLCVHLHSFTCTVAPNRTTHYYSTCRTHHTSINSSNATHHATSHTTYC